MNMLINTVCGNGLGSSLILKINVDKILKELGIDAQVEAKDVGSVPSSDAELFVTTTQFKPNLENLEKNIIYVNNVMDKDVLREQLEDYFSNRS
ncbi:PTS sugar transporter subunit IIB [Aerococcus tenax]|uniref:PTS sugar transporter subunit IIB n=2 Tax=Aerococcaceae TaxID=186827 RepID=A0A5N1BSV5_9LACT|nr:PTS sugar transporter subunit IIB [Aerococcus urinae]RAV70841.1 PTS ascorbate transporter subunit IIB [Aerococcus urinae]RAW04691.1 PTS ascorbate transporter subunit IIB [Aerococcus urinae]